MGVYATTTQQSGPLSPSATTPPQLLLEAEKKLANKLSLHVEQAVEVEESLEQFNHGLWRQKKLTSIVGSCLRLTLTRRLMWTKR